MQTQKEFTKSIIQEVENIIGNDYNVKVLVTEKINMGRLHALVISKDVVNISQNFYTEELYRDYQSGRMTIREMAVRIASSCYNSTDSIEELKSLGKYINDKEWAEERLFLQLINSSKNKSLLENSVHMDFNGLSLVLYVLAADNKAGMCRARVTKSMCQGYGWNEKEILDYALENTARLFPYCLCTLQEILQKELNITGAEAVELPSVGNDMLVLTNEKYVNGAAAIFYPGVLKEISEKHGTSFFLIPSSIHEFIILEDNGVYSPAELESMVKDVNNSSVLPEELLSDNVYYYGCNTGMLSVFTNGSFKEICSL